MMNRRFQCILLIALLMALGGAGGAATFRFAFITDTHVGSAPATPALPKVVADINEQDVAFVVHTGDITEMGAPDQWAQTKEILGKLKAPLHIVTGNHDARWGLGGRPELKEYLGKSPFERFDYGGCRFFMLESSVPLTSTGHYGREQMNWLKAELAKDPQTPTFLLCHFPPDGADCDNSAELRDLVAPYRLVAVLVGHGHSDRQLEWQGIHQVMGRDTYSGAPTWNLVTVDGDQVTFADKPAGQPAKAPWATVKIPAAGEPKVEFISPKPKQVVQGETPIKIQMAPGSEVTGGRFWVETGLDKGKEAPLTLAKDLLTASLDAGELPAGAHRLKLAITLADGRTVSREGYFYTEGKSPKALWRHDLAADIVASPAADSERVYVATMNGKLTALGASDGKPRWSFAAGGFLFSSPWVDGKTVFQGSADKTLYAVNAETGKKLWSYEASAPFFASPVVSDKLVLAAAGSEMIALDKATGELKWKFAAGGNIVCRPAVGAGMVTFGAWDGLLHAVRVATGKEAWKLKLANSARSGPATSWPAVSYDKVIVTTLGRETFGIDLRTGMVAWSWKNEACDSVGAAGDLVFTRGLDGKMNAYVPTGQPKWSVDGGWGWDYIPSMPQGMGEKVLTGCRRGYVSCFKAEDGALLWKYQAGFGYMVNSIATTPTATYAATLDGVVTAIQ